VFIAERVEDFKGQIPRKIVVSVMTMTTFAPYLKNALALITDEGGLTSHPAITAREFKIPCVVATKVGTQIFKDGDMVEVDADKGIVRRISK